MEGIKILLACNAGMSTSMLIKKIEEAAAAKGMAATIQAMPVEDVKNHCDDFDVILLGPQIKYQMKGIQQAVNGSIPVDAIDMSAYGLMNGAKVLEQAIALVGK